MQDYKTVIGESVEDNGMKVTLNEVILDEGQLLISSTFHTELTDEDLDYNWFSDIDIYINGGELLLSGGGRQEITHSTVNHFWAADLQNIALQDNQRIKIVFNNLERSDLRKVTKGKWSFEFTASGLFIYQIYTVRAINFFVIGNCLLPFCSAPLSLIGAIQV